MGWCENKEVNIYVLQTYFLCDGSRARGGRRRSGCDRGRKATPWVGYKEENILGATGDNKNKISNHFFLESGKKNKAWRETTRKFRGKKEPMINLRGSRAKKKTRRTYMGKIISHLTVFVL